MYMHAEENQISETVPNMLTNSQVASDKHPVSINFLHASFII